MSHGEGYVSNGKHLIRRDNHVKALFQGTSPSGLVLQGKAAFRVVKIHGGGQKDPAGNHLFAITGACCWRSLAAVVPGAGVTEGLFAGIEKERPCHEKGNDQQKNSSSSGLEFWERHHFLRRA